MARFFIPRHFVQPKLKDGDRTVERSFLAEKHIGNGRRRWVVVVIIHENSRIEE